MPEEKTATAMSEEKNEQAVLCTCDYMKCVCGSAEQFGTTDQEVVEQKTTMKDRIAAIMNESKLKEQEAVAQPVYAKNGVKKGNLYIPKDVPIMLSLIDPLDTRKTVDGQTFRLAVEEDVIINDVIVIAKEQEVVGHVLKSRRSGGFGSGGKFKLNIPYVETLNGVQVPVNGYIDTKGERDEAASGVVMWVSVLGGAFMKGKNIEYVQGQLFKVTVNKDTDLEATPDNLEEVMSVDRTRTQSITVSVAE